LFTHLSTEEATHIIQIHIVYYGIVLNAAHLMNVDSTPRRIRSLALLYHYIMHCSNTL